MHITKLSWVEEIIMTVNFAPVFFNMLQKTTDAGSHGFKVSEVMKEGFFMHFPQIQNIIPEKLQVL